MEKSHFNLQIKINEVLPAFETFRHIKNHTKIIYIQSET